MTRMRIHSSKSYTAKTINFSIDLTFKRWQLNPNIHETFLQRTLLHEIGPLKPTERNTQSLR